MIIVPPGASPHPIARHLGDAGHVEVAHAQANAAEYTPEFVDGHQLATVRILAERIVPGSAEARSAEFIDQLLAVSTPDEQRKFLQALSAFEGLALNRSRVSWMQLPEQQQLELLTLASTAKPGSSAEKTQPTSRMRSTLRFATISRISRGGSSARTIHPSAACASWAGRATSSSLRFRVASTLGDTVSGCGAGA